MYKLYNIYIHKHLKTVHNVLNELILVRIPFVTLIGDHHGLRDKWDAYCAEHGVKSCIRHYKDNRFNSLFETVYHRKDFLQVLDSVEKLNMLLQSVKADLNSETVVTFLHCYAIFYLKITGPYWNLMTSGKVNYPELSPHIQELKSFLEHCV